ncbi:signal recognition particle-docking protein FtsY [Orrella sp. JC864]|uniref:signal recognition particle-docking protein FtsY n=1 Tax=Orrella sp. JC864 TaxID=3120298 RepID=UPI003008F736
MFNFFKKKPPAPPPAPEREEAGAQAQPPQAPEPVPAPEPEPAPAPAEPAASASAASASAEESAFAESAAPPAVPAPSLGATPADEPQPLARPEAAGGSDAAAAKEKSSWLNRLRSGLSRTGKSLSGLFVGVKVDESLFEELETALIMADAGVEATEKLLAALRAKVRKDRIDDAQQVKAALRELLAEHLKPLERTFDLQRAKPLVVMIAGVNGAGKTTSIGKLANTFQAQGASVLLAAGDTFRAAAREQLIEWGARNNVTVISQDGGDPAAVSFDAVNAGRARGAGVVMIDTAGRLPTQLHLMEELKKIRRVIGKADPAAPHEVLLVLDGNTGQNALAQIRAFDAAINLTGLVVTKLDGTAKGGTLAAVAAGSQGVRPVPVYWIGVGEGMQDLQPFVAKDFAAALLGD